VSFSFLLVVVCGSAQAGGLYLNEFTTPSMGTAGAGSAAWANDASTAFHNPAGMTRIEGKEFMFGVGFLYSDVNFDPASDTPFDGGDGGDAGGFSPIGALFYTQTISDEISVGLNITSAAGAVVDYTNTWTGRYQCQEVSIFTFAVNPSLAYQVNDQFSVAAGLGIIYGELDLDVAVPNILPNRPDGKASLDGDDLVASFNLAAMYELNEATRLGMVYWHETEFDFSGDAKIDPPGAKGGIDTELILPHVIKASFYHELNDTIALVGTVGWEDWSELDYINISVPKGTVKLPKHWDDTWHYSGGIHYHVSDLWMLHCGIAYDSSPVTREYRTADMPIGRQVRYAVGATYEYSEKLTIGSALEYADYGSAHIDSDVLKGKYGKNQIYFGSVSCNWKF
jgi:long-chain fatty acid transport protein